MVAGADRSRPLGPGYFRKRSLVLYFRGVLAGGGDRVGTRTSGEHMPTRPLTAPVAACVPASWNLEPSIYTEVHIS